MSDYPMEPKEKPYGFEKHKGKIMELRKNDPALEAKRIEAVVKSNRAMPHNLKHGRYAKAPVIYCKEACPKADMCEGKKIGEICIFDKRWETIVQKVQTRNPELIGDTITAIIRAGIKRFALNLGFEELDGGYLDKNVTVLQNYLIQWAEKLIILSRATPGTQINVGGNLMIQKVSNIVDRLPKEDREKYRQVLSEIEPIDTSEVETEPIEETEN